MLLMAEFVGLEFFRRDAYRLEGAVILIETSEFLSIIYEL